MLHAKKSLGQHFLRDPRILQKIVAATALSPTDVVLEVGPGEGTLTELLLRRAGKVIAVEKDDRLLPLLQGRFAAEIASGKLELVHSDVLEFPISNFQFPKNKYKIVANIPYYITGNLLRKFLQEAENQPRSMTLLLQKEVAKRIVAAENRESILSLSVKCYGTPRYVDTVKAGAFSPPPKVDSAILAIENISKDFFVEVPRRHSCESSNPVEKEKALDSRFRGNDRERHFFSMLKRGFAHPRKLLSSNLNVPSSALQECGIAPKARAENLSLENWRCLMEEKTG